MRCRLDRWRQLRRTQNATTGERSQSAQVICALYTCELQPNASGVEAQLLSDSVFGSPFR